MSKSTSARQRGRVTGLDFGTTNSALAVVTPGQEPQLASFWSQRGETSSFRSVMYFEPDLRDERGRAVPVTGPQGIDLYLEGDGDGRLIQSMKTYLVSRLFRRTMVFGTVYGLEDLIACLLKDLKAEAEARLGGLGQRAVVGRPVHLSRQGDAEDDDFAIERLRKAVQKGGFEAVEFEYEPVAAAYHYERRLDHDELVLIADFGGGTSDFSLIHVGPGSRRRPGEARRQVLGSGGVPVAGNALDSQLVKQVLAPALGLGSRYTTIFGKSLPIPPRMYADLEWHRLSMLKTGEALETLEELESRADEPEKLRAFVHIIKYNLGYHLYRAVEQTKVELSSSERSVFRFVDGPVQIEEEIHRGDFEGWVAQELEAIAGCVDDLLAEVGVGRGDVDRVFMTGGSSFVPAVRQIFVDRFGQERIRSGGELTSVALGLALRAMDMVEG